MNILVVSSYLPYPLDSGGHVRLYNVLKQLAKRHTITLVCEKRSTQKQDDIQEVRKFCEEIYIFERKKQWSFSTILKTGFSSLPFLVVGHSLPEMKAKINKLLREKKFDIIHAETFYITQNIPKTSVPVVLVEHNIEYLVYKRYSHQVPFFLRPLFSLDIKKLEKSEKNAWQKATRLAAVSEIEQKQMQRKDAVVIPNGVDCTKFKIQNAKHKVNEDYKRILFIGNFKWMQNTDACWWIIKDIWPKLRFQYKEKNSQLLLWIVGKHIPDSIKNLSTDKNIIFDEHASSDTTKIFAEADILLAPIRVGGGTSYKILEAMASGIPVVTTSLGALGLNAKNNKEILIGDTAQTLVVQVLRLLADKALAQTLQIQARKLVEEKYTWEIIALKLESLYKSAML